MPSELVSKIRRQVVRPTAPPPAKKAELPPERSGWVPGQTATDTVTVQYFGGPPEAETPNALSGPSLPPETTEAQRAGLAAEAALLNARRREA